MTRAGRVFLVESGDFPGAWRIVPFGTNTDITLQTRHPDPEAHEAGCMNIGADIPFSDPGDTYVDVFCDCHRFTEPKILPNGTDIAWPAGWNAEQARQWRVRNDLVPPAELEVLAITDSDR